MTAAQPTGDQSFRDFEHSGWQVATARYAALTRDLTGQFIEPLLDATGVGPGMRVLDVATGPGSAAAAVARRGAGATGVDFSENMLAEARRAHPDVTFELGDAEALRFAAGEFDAVVCSFGLLHFTNPEQAVAEALRVLRPGGRYAATVWDTPEHGPLFRIVQQAVQQHGDPSVPLPAGPPMFRFSDPAEFRRLLEVAGFSGVQITAVPGTFSLASADELYQFVAGATARMAGLLRAQTAEARDAIRAGMQESVAAYERNGSIELPMQAVLASARKSA